MPFDPASGRNLVEDTGDADAWTNAEHLGFNAEHLGFNAEHLGFNLVTLEHR